MRWNEIFTESQQLNELFDRVATWDWTNIHEMGREAKFEVNGTPYLLELWCGLSKEDIWSAEFKNMAVYHGRWGNTGTMEHEGIQVFGTVISILKKFVEEVHPKMITFQGYVDEKRDDLYQRMLHHQMADIKKLGYKLESEHKGSHMEFDLIRVSNDSEDEAESSES